MPIPAVRYDVAESFSSPDHPWRVHITLRDCCQRLRKYKIERAGLNPPSGLLVRTDLNGLRFSTELHFNDLIVVEHNLGGLGFIRELNPLDWNVSHDFPGP